MNQRAKAYIDYLRDMCSHKKDLLNYDNAPTVEPVGDAAMIDFVKARYGRDHGEELAVHGYNMSYWMGRFEQDLFEDLEHYCSEPDRHAMQRIALGYISRLNTNAFAEQVKDEGVYAIGVNTGLLLLCSRLCQALLLEEAEQSEIAREAYNLALTQYHAATQADFYRATFKLDQLSDHNILIQSGALGSVILRFVGLHELGHVVAGDVETAGICLLPDTGEVRYDKCQFMDGDAVHELELKADRFAIDHMLAKTGSPEQMWNNTLFISAFFLLLEHIELMQGKPICMYHPLPGVRQRALADRVREAIGAPPIDVMIWLEQTMLAWRT
jgi:hypothetical protein